MNKLNILNLQINNISKEKALTNIIELAQKRQSSFVCFINAHMTVEANKDNYILNVVNSATYALADGYPVAKAFKYIHKVNQQRIAGMDFFPDMLRACEQMDLKISLLGSTEDVLDDIEARAAKEFPNLIITNKISPPFKKPWSNKDYINAINNTYTNIVFVALGCPLQEKWMFENYNNINAVLLGVGGAFPVYAEKLSRAPRWMANYGFEWLYRLAKEPKRLWERYLYTNTAFLKILLLRLIKSER